jgi:hypothetical protein
MHYGKTILHHREAKTTLILNYFGGLKEGAI